jgi:hypothetical protein
MFKYHIQFPMYYPPEVADKGVDSKSSGGKDLSKSDILDYLKDDDTDDKEVIDLEDDDKKSSKKSKDDEDKDEDKDEVEDDDLEVKDDLNEIEEDLDEPDEEKLELTTPTSRREILKKYPKLFKDFPYLETAYYREQEFTKLLPTIADAKEAVNQSQILNRLEGDLATGNTEVLLKSIKDNNPKAFYKIADNYLATLSKVDEKAYHHVMGNTMKHTILSMIEESRASSNESLQEAAMILHQFVFGTTKFTPTSKLSSDDKPEIDEKEQKISQREREFTQQRFESANETLSGKVTSIYKNSIEANIDPKDSMSPYVKKTAVRDAMEELETLIEKDNRFTTLVDKLWERAMENDFDSDSVGRIKSAFISKARTLLPTVIKNARNEALKGSSSKSSKDDDSRPRKESKSDNDSRPRSRESTKDDGSHRKNDSGSKIPKGMTSLEYLMSDD